MSTLYVFYEEELVGVFQIDEEEAYSFQYDESWLGSENGFDLSLQLPRQKNKFGNRVTLSFFENLLPEGNVLHVLETNHRTKGPFQILRKYGEDCAGAIIVTDSVTSPNRNESSTEKQLQLSDIEAALRQGSIVDFLAESNPGYLSLAGAQDKFPAIVRNGQIFLPMSGQPTTHIIKPPIRRMGLKESVYNEYYCMKLAKLVGLNVPEVSIISGKSYPLFVIERFDRTEKGGKLHRLHIQDFCQAHGFPSRLKYQKEGGPTFIECCHMVKENVHFTKKGKDLLQLVDWLCFNLLIGNNDCHSKNISLLSKNRRYELAPFYDLLCTSIYPTLPKDFAFSIGEEWNTSSLSLNRDIVPFDEKIPLKSGILLIRLQKMYDALKQHKDGLAEDVQTNFPQCKIAKRIAEKIEKRARGFRTIGLEL